MKSVCEENNFRELFTNLAAPLRNFLYYKCMDLDRAEDLMQEALVRLWENCAKVEFGKAKSFLYTVGQRLLIDQIRKQKTEWAFVERQSDRTDHDPAFELLHDEFGQRLQAAITAMPDTQREAFLMNRIDQLSYAEIAERLGISVKAVEKRMHLALLFLKEKVEELQKHKI
jgi:RNA polymerase sigma-70 factor (ECF subfamily)